MIIEKGTYGSYGRPCVYITDEQTGYREYIEYYQIREDSEYFNLLMSKIEYCLKNNIEVKVEGFREEEK